MSTAVAGRLLRELFEVRRLHPGAAPCPDPASDCCVRAHLPVVLPPVADGRPVTCVLPAFPAKSPSPRKVLGPHPDLAEEQGLRFLHQLCLRLGEVHPPGVRVVICSDGRVFSDVVGVSDEDVETYRGELEAMISRLGLHTLSVFCLEDALPGLSYDRMREVLARDHAEPLGAVRTRVLTDPESKLLFNGIHRFLTEDRAAVEPLRSRSWLRRDCKDRAYRLIQRSAAWGGLVAERFPGAVRLSIHPQAPHAPKIGVLLSDQPRESWLTPWHSVCVRTGDGYRFLHRHDAEALGARLVLADGRPSHYDLRRSAPDTPAAAVSAPGGNP
ncbi:isocyanide synthase family protein [Amycolatopsis sp. 195334CR]|uniref:isocyanide synthase family protein n=1 Tax=Amycolatopsis sp. 195334CR TaxID=2814588 RepID=UPI001A8F67A2|nr:isocyanide synthase family protein [Amycolatopsis sp. 195334CR]MBN6040429.1 isocyanide synthase family protein [Amycolatopsis sp. 195334CR]